MIITPANLGADVVVYSMTKYINGASDLIAGAICSTTQFINELMHLHRGRVMLLGPTIDSRISFDIIQRLPHLAVRMREHGRRTVAIAEMLEKNGLKVCYPGLKNYPQYKLFTSMMNENYGHGGILTLDCGTKD